MKLRRPESLALIVSLTGSLAVLAAFAFGLVTARQEEILHAEERLEHFTVMLAEHTSRSLDGVDILLRELARDLSQHRRDWPKWEQSRAWEYISERHSRALPQLRSLSVFDEQGEQRMQSTNMVPKSINVSDRPYFAALLKGSDSASFGPLVGRNSGVYSFGLARRIVGADGIFSGVAYAALDISYFQDFCWPIRLHDDFEAVLVNASGQVIASCRPVDLSRNSPLIGTQATDTLFGGALKKENLEQGTRHVSGHLLAVVPVASHPDLRVLAVLPDSAALTLWQRRLREFGLFAAVVVVILLSGGWLVRRQVAALARLSAELAGHRQELQQRVSVATGELAKQKEEAELASTAKSRFLAAASHDLRQPLHALSLFAADLQRQVSSGHTRDLDKLATQINTSVVSLAEMLDALLDISRLDMGGVQLELSVFPLQTVFDRLHLAFRRAAVNKRIRLRIRPTRAYVHSDIHLVERLLANLVSNAIRYTPEGGKVLVGARPRHGRLHVDVRDNGLGIAPEHQEMIFKEFFQVGNEARDQKQGLGLGLAIVQRLARALGATLQLKSRLGAGTLFAIDLEMAAPPAAQLPAELPKIYLAGPCADAERLIELAESWGYRCCRIEVAELGERGKSESGAIVIVADAVAAAAGQALPPGWPLVVLGGAADEGRVGLSLPLKPAKLRALLQQLQNTLSKSIR